MRVIIIEDKDAAALIDQLRLVKMEQPDQAMQVLIRRDATAAKLPPGGRPASRAGGHRTRPSAVPLPCRAVVAGARRNGSAHLLTQEHTQTMSDRPHDSAQPKPYQNIGGMDSPTLDPIDRQRWVLEGFPHTRPTTFGYRSSSSIGERQYTVQTYRVPEMGDTVFVTMVEGDRVVKLELPPPAIAAIDRQRDSLSTTIRKAHGRRIAKERAARGLAPGFMKNPQRGRTGGKKR